MKSPLSRRNQIRVARAESDWDVDAAEAAPQARDERRADPPAHMGAPFAPPPAAAPAQRVSPPNAAKRAAGGPQSDFGGKGILAVKGLQKSYRGRAVVQDAALYVREGEAVGLLGPNGAGKTTIFYMITGLVAADRGLISLDGHDITHLPMYRRARLGIGYLPQEASIFRGLNVEDNIRAVLEVVEPNRKARERQLDALLEEFNIARLRKAPSIALSGGERRRCEIARALAGGRPSCCSTSRSPASIRSRSATSRTSSGSSPGAASAC